MKILAVLPILTSIFLTGCLSREPVPNPDPNHTHADFALFVLGQKLDFSDQRYMSNPYEEDEDDADEATSFIPLVDTASAHEGEENEEEAIEGRKYLHLHDGVGTVIHRHKPGLTLHDFFDSIGLPLSSECMKLDTFQFATLPQAQVSDFALDPQLCNTGKFYWTTVINGQKFDFLLYDYLFEDGDKILFSYGASDTAWMDEYKEVTDDACLYSKTCPWRGDPPAENCIADPEVPCVIPE